MNTRSKSDNLTTSVNGIGEESNNNPQITSFEAVLDQRLKTQSEQLQDLMFKYWKSLEDDLKEVKKSQAFIGEKFDQFVITINQLKNDNETLRAENTELKMKTNSLSNKVTALEEDIESLQQYTRRECVEIHGVPEVRGESTDMVVIKVGELIGDKITKDDISVSHRLKSKPGKTPPIIVKFVRRNTRDSFYRKRKLLKDKRTVDLGFTKQSRIFVNESLTRKGKELLYQVKQFKQDHNFKYLWTNSGRIYLRKNDGDSSDTIIFRGMKDFNLFKLRHEQTASSGDNEEIAPSDEH